MLVDKYIYQLGKNKFRVRIKIGNKSNPNSIDFSKTINGTFHKGNLPENYCGFETENQNIIVTAIKENKTHGTIIRFYDADGVTQNVNIKLYDKNINADVSHNQVKTLTLSGETLDFIENEQ